MRGDQTEPNIHVGVIANTFESVFGAKAGGHVHFIEVAKRWLDFKITVFGPEIARSTIARELPKATFVAMPSNEGAIRNKQLRNLYRTGLSVLRRKELRRCDVLLATSHFLPDVVPSLFANGGRSIVCIQHLLDPPNRRSGNPVANLISTIFQSASIALIRARCPAILVNMAETARRAGMMNHGKRVALMTHGIEHLNSDTAVIGDANRNGVAYLGRLVATKGIDDLLRAWKLVRKHVPDARLTIAGTGSPAYQRHMRALLQHHAIEDSVDCVGWIDESTKNEILNSARVFAFPSHEEGWGIALAEAMIHGLPCVTYDLPAYRDVFIRGRISARLGDVLAFASHIIHLLHDEAACAKLASEAFTLAKGFSWDRAAEIEGSLVREIAGRRHSSRAGTTGSVAL